MSTSSSNAVSDKQVSYGTRMTYILGFVLSLALTLAGYLLVKSHIANHHLSPSDTFMTAVLPLLAIIQLFAQLIFFLHLDKESKPRWNLLVLSFAALIVLVIVVGSLWIMYHLNYNMTPQQQNDYLLKQDGGI